MNILLGAAFVICEEILVKHTGAKYRLIPVPALNDVAAIHNISSHCVFGTLYLNDEFLIILSCANPGDDHSTTFSINLEDNNDVSKFCEYFDSYCTLRFKKKDINV